MTFLWLWLEKDIRVTFYLKMLKLKVFQLTQTLIFRKGLFFSFQAVKLHWKHFGQTKLLSDLKSLHLFSRNTYRQNRDWILRLDAREGAVWKSVTESRKGASCGTELTGVTQRGIWAQSCLSLFPLTVLFPSDTHPTQVIQ